MTIDGFTQTGASPNTLPAGNNAVLTIELNGASAGTGADGLVVTAGSATISGLAITGFRGNGMVLQTGGNIVAGNYIGIDPTGLVDVGSGLSGVRITDAPNNTIGGTSPAARNVISGNDLNGVSISGTTATGNRVQGNFIGTTSTGTADLGNTGDGVEVFGAPGNIIGGDEAGAGNVISGNNGNGISLVTAEATGNQIQGNLIGLNLQGNDLGNSGHGIGIDNAPGNTIGNTSLGARNVISGNDVSGVRIAGSTASGNQVIGNFIGTSPNGTAATGNSFDGVWIFNAPNNTIGGTAPGAGNVTSENGAVGVRLESSGATGTELQGNIIGADASGTSDLGNSFDGVFVTGAPGN